MTMCGSLTRKKCGGFLSQTITFFRLWEATGVTFFSLAFTTIEEEVERIWQSGERGQRCLDNAEGGEMVGL